MNPWARRKGKCDYAEWFPERDLHVASKWECAAEETHPEHVQVITHVDVVAEENELEETAIEASRSTRPTSRRATAMWILR